MDDVQRNDSMYPADNAFAITPDDDADLPVTTRAIHVNTDGVVVAIFAGDTDPSPELTVVSGMDHAWRLKRVMETTTAVLVGFR